MANVDRDKIVEINQKGWNIVAPKFYGGTALPKYGPLAQTEDQLHLIDDLTGKAALELGCGSGHTLAYLSRERHAAELWGLDLSETQLGYTREYLDEEKIPARLFLASMDENPGIPLEHFDLVVSIYALGWTPDLGRTLALARDYLKPGGILVFSGEHPAYQCLEYCPEKEAYIFRRPLLQEGPEILPDWNEVEIVISSRTMSTFINATVEAGLQLVKVIESEANPALAREKDLNPAKWYSLPRARMVPTTLIVKARKEG